MVSDVNLLPLTCSYCPLFSSMAFSGDESVHYFWLYLLSLKCQLRVFWNFSGIPLEEEVQENGQSVGSLYLGKGSSDCSVSIERDPNGLLL